MVVGESIAKTGKQQTVLWRGGKIAPIRTLGGGFSGSIEINDHGQVIGSSVPAGGAVVHAFLWQSGKSLDLRTLRGAESDAAAINEHGQIGGGSNAANGPTHAGP